MSMLSKQTTTCASKMNSTCKGTCWESLSSITRTHIVEGERTSSLKFSSDIHTHGMKHASLYSHTK